MLPETMTQTVSNLGSGFNGAVAAALATIIIPRYLREPHTGKVTGFDDIALKYIFLFYAFFNALVVVPRFGMSFESLIRVLVTTALPFVGAAFFVWLTDVMGWDNSSQIRK